MVKKTEETDNGTGLSFTRTNYDVRYDALQFSIETYADNRSNGPDDVIDGAVKYENFLKEVQND